MGTLNIDRKTLASVTRQMIERFYDKHDLPLEIGSWRSTCDLLEEYYGEWAVMQFMSISVCLNHKGLEAQYYIPKHHKDMMDNLLGCIDEHEKSKQYKIMNTSCVASVIYVIQSFGWRGWVDFETYTSYVAADNRLFDLEKGGNGVQFKMIKRAV